MSKEVYLYGLMRRFMQERTWELVPEDTAFVVQIKDGAPVFCTLTGAESDVPAVRIFEDEESYQMHRFCVDPGKKDCFVRYFDMYCEVRVGDLTQLTDVEKERMNRVSPEYKAMIGHPVPYPRVLWRLPFNGMAVLTEDDEQNEILENVLNVVHEFHMRALRSGGRISDKLDNTRVNDEIPVFRPGEELNPVHLEEVPADLIFSDTPKWQDVEGADVLSTLPAAGRWACDLRPMRKGVNPRDLYHNEDQDGEIELRLPMLVFMDAQSGQCLGMEVIGDPTEDKMYPGMFAMHCRELGVRPESIVLRDQSLADLLRDVCGQAGIGLVTGELPEGFEQVVSDMDAMSDQVISQTLKNGLSDLENLSDERLRTSLSEHLLQFLMEMEGEGDLPETLLPVMKRLHNLFDQPFGGASEAGNTGTSKGEEVSGITGEDSKGEAEGAMDIRDILESLGINYTDDE